jgi:hypothetical protein
MDRRPHSHSTLMVHPNVYEGTLLDHIVLGALTLEHDRLTLSGPRSDGSPARLSPATYSVLLPVVQLSLLTCLIVHSRRYEPVLPRAKSGAP